MRVKNFLVCTILICSSLNLKAEITQQRFYQITQEVLSLYRTQLPYAEEDFSLIMDWEDNSHQTQAAQTYNQDGKKWSLKLTGGLARDPKMSEAGFALIVCHEIGHFIGGAPYKRDFPSGHLWSSTEGQADFFAATKCFKNYLKETTVLPLSQHTKLDYAQKICETNSSNPGLCERVISAGHDLASYFYQRRLDNDWPLGPELNADFSDLKAVFMTKNGHPTPKCRLKTYVAGALCEKTGKNQYCTREDSPARKSRPRCWFAP